MKGVSQRIVGILGNLIFLEFLQPQGLLSAFVNLTLKYASNVCLGLTLSHSLTGEPLKLKSHLKLMQMVS